MLRDTAVARVKQMLGFKQNLDAEIVQAMIEIQEDLERSSELPDFLRKPYTALATAASIQTVTVPPDFIREWEQDPMVITNSSGVDFPITKDEPKFLRLRYPIFDQETGLPNPGVPAGYYLLDRTFYFYPTPDVVYTINGAYYAKDTDLSANVENKWMKELPFLLVARSGLFLAGGLRDKNALASFGAMNDIFTAKLHLMTTANDQAGAKPVIGGED